MKNISKRIVLLLLILLSGCGRKNTEYISPVVQIRAGEVSGSGLLYAQRENELIVVTAAHVLQSAVGSVEVIFADGNVAGSDSYKLSRAADIAFISVLAEELTDDGGQRYQPVCTDKQRFDSLAGGEAVSLTGITSDGEKRELDSSILYPWIYTVDFNQYMMLLNGEILPGMSGGGVFDPDDNFLGVLCGVSQSREVAAVPLSIILSEYSLLYE